jgi:hypothetical protein
MSYQHRTARVASAISLLADFVARSMPLIDEMSDRSTARGAPPSLELIDTARASVRLAQRQIAIIAMYCEAEDLTKLGEVTADAA